MLHEDLNVVLKKPYIVEKDFLPDQNEDEYYKIAKSNMDARDKSIVHDLLYGVFRSVATCPECNHTRLKFESFNMLSLSVNNSDRAVIHVYKLNEYRIYEVHLLKFELTLDKKLKDLVSLYASEKNEDTTGITVYIYDNKKYKFRSITEEEKEYNYRQKLSIMKEHEYLFFVHDRNMMLGGLDTKVDDKIMVYLMIEGVKEEDVVGLKKPFIIRKYIHVRYLYQFVYVCLQQIYKNLPTFTDMYNDDNTYERLFDILYNDEVLPIKSYRDEYMISIDDLSILTIRILNKDVKSNEKLRKITMISTDKDSSNIGAKITNIMESLDTLTNTEYLDEDNTWKCEKCKENRKAKLQVKIKKLPPVLIIHLKRFKKTASGRSAEKIEAQVDFPSDDLEISKYTTDPMNKDNKIKYKLFAIIHHFGSLDFGHYTSTIRISNNKWCEYNDSKMRNVDTESATKNKQSPYILFYKSC